MQPWRMIWIALLLGVELYQAGLGWAQQPGRKRILLLTPQEAEQLRLTVDEWRQSTRMRALPTGPRIVVRYPEINETEAGPVIEAISPTSLSLRFEETQAPVDMTSLQVKATKGIFTKSLTSLLQPHIQGTSLDVENVEIPEGRFRITIEIADVEGATTVETYGLEVRKR
jgi:hypothetical protein